MRSLVLPLFAVMAAPAWAEPVRLVVSGTDVMSDGGLSVDLLAVNSGPDALVYAVPETLHAEAGAPDGTRTTLTLTRDHSSASRVPIMAGGFVGLHYAARLAPGTAGMLSIAIKGAPAIALNIPAAGSSSSAPPVADPPAIVAAAPPPPAPPSAGSVRDNPFLANLSAYEPMYFVYGPNTDTATRIQISLKYQLLGRRGNWLDGITFAYTQRMFWDIERASAPFRDVNYMPELFYLVPPRAVGDGGVTVGGRFGARHESNGRSGAASRSLNTVYVQPEATIPVGTAALTLGPRLWTYVGGLEDNPDIARYRGRTGLYAAFGADDGLRLSLTSRLNIGSGKGAVDGVLSYPLTKAWASGPQLYLIAQGFRGYGESLLDYRVRQTRLRLGFGITR